MERPDLPAPGTGKGSSSVTVHVTDLEPVLGLVAAVARYCAHLTPPAYEAMTDGATAALTEIQAILWRLKISIPEPDPQSEPAEKG